MRITSRGQVTIPQAIRERHGLMPDTEVEFVEHAGEIVLRRAEGGRPDRAERLVAGMRGRAQSDLSTDEILRLTREYDRDE